MNRHNDWNVKFYIATWNVSTKYPDNISLHKLLSLENNPQDDTNLPDFYVIGLQEVNANPQNTLINLFKDDPWTQKFIDILRDRDYVVVKTEQMQGLLLSVFAKRKHILHLREIETEYTRTGLAGIWGNKGAVSIRLNVYGCSVCLVNSHLAAHDSMLDERVSDYNRIVTESKFHVKTKQNIFSHDYVFWFGDLNFRLTGEATTSPENIAELIEKDELKKLVEKDQLTLVRKERRAFYQLNEKIPQFPPTFKFEQGTSNYDMKRRPAWCDRILYHVNEDNYKNVKLASEQISYKSHPTYTISDHKPVSSEFTIKVTKKPFVSGERLCKNYKDSKRMTRDARNNFDALLTDLIDGQVYEDDSEKTVVFTPIEMWYNGEENVVEYILPQGFEQGGADWVGIYEDNFVSLNDYKAYEYAESADPQHMLNEQQIQLRANSRAVQITFSDNVILNVKQQFRLLYFQSTGTRGVTGLAGISEVFGVDKRCPSPSFDDID